MSLSVSFVLFLPCVEAFDGNLISKQLSSADSTKQHKKPASRNQLQKVLERIIIVTARPPHPQNNRWMLYLNTDGHSDSDSYNEHLLSAQRLGESGDNPQEPGQLIDSSSISPPAIGGWKGRVKNVRWGCTKYLPRILTAVIAVALVGVVFGFLPYLAVHSAKHEHYSEMLYFVAGVFVLITVPITVQGIVQHLVNWYMPQVQKFVVRILFMVPIFSIQAWFSLFFHGAYGYIRAFRELYEAFVLASFVYYIIELLGGEDQLALTLRRKDAQIGSHPCPFRVICEEWQMGRQFMMNCKYGVLQYVLVKIISTIAVVALSSKGLFHQGEWSWTSGYGYIAVAMNVSIAYALYCLVKLYYATKDDLRDWNPVAKFLCIKGVIFFTFWQGFAIQVLYSVGVIKGIGDWDPVHVVDGIAVRVELLSSVEFITFVTSYHPYQLMFVHIHLSS